MCANSKHAVLWYHDGVPLAKITRYENNQLKSDKHNVPNSWVPVF